MSVMKGSLLAAMAGAFLMLGGCATTTTAALEKCDVNNCPAGCVKKTNVCGAGDRCCDARVPALPCKNCTQ